VLFTDPEYARIGLSEKEAGEKGIAYKLAKIPFGAILRAQTLGETNGFMKALIDPGNDQVIGFHALGVDAGEIMGAVQIAMMAKLPYTILRDAPFAHPTLVEGLVPLFSNVQS
jgi:pyruvate/2-oxoglutarate dehydrogenase complex dihydrolipoamide dehydrogenase (E3) component